MVGPLRDTARTAGALLLLALPFDAHAAWRQDRFLIGGFGVGTTFDSTRLVLLNDAGLDFVVNSDQGAPSAKAHAFAAGLERLRRRRPGFTMQAIVYAENYYERGALFKNRNPKANRGAIVNELAAEGFRNPSVAGWMVWDEPPFDYGGVPDKLSDDKVFTNIGDMTRVMRDSTRSRMRPLLPYVNLMPIHLYWAFPAACRNRADTLEAYRCYLDRYLQQFDRDALPAPVLSFDNYPFEVPHADLRRYFLQHAIVRDKAKQFSRANYRIPVWSLIQASPRRETPVARWQPTPTFAQVRWQAYVSIAYGARGIVYWTSSPIQADPNGVGYGASFVTADGRRNGALYDSLRSLNAELHTLGPTLMALDPVAVHHVAANGMALPPGEGPGSASTLVARITEPAGTRQAGDAMVGVFRHVVDGAHYLLVVNKGLARAASFEVALRGPTTGRVERIDRTSGRPVATPLSESRSFTTPPVPPGGGVLYRIGGT